MKKRIVSKPTQRILSMMLACVMLLVSIPFAVVAQGLPLGGLEADDNAELVGKTDTFYEDVSMRDEFSKHYVLESGERYAVIFPEAVHYDDGGEWKEVDTHKGIVPNALVPQAIAEYVTKNYPNSKITEIKRNHTYTEVTLKGGLELTFNRDYKLVDVDD